MTGRSALVVSAIVMTGCGPRMIRVSDTPPAAVQMRLQEPHRVWVAGFMSDAGSDQIDLNIETVRFVRDELRRTGATVIDADPIALRDKKELEDAAYWRRLGEEHNAPLIVTGTVRLLLAPPVVVQRGKRTQYVARSGRVLDATMVLVDGGSGRILLRRELRRRTRYGSRDVSNGLGLYLEAMRDARNEWLSVIAHGVELCAADYPETQTR